MINVPVNPWTQKICLLTLPPAPPVEFNLCIYGHMFIELFIESLLLVFLSVYCFIRLMQLFPHGSHQHRKLLFVLMFSLGMVRGVHSAVCIAKIAPVQHLFDEFALMNFFMDTIVPVNALGDLITAYIDFLLTYFWVTVLLRRPVGNETHDADGVTRWKKLKPVLGTLALGLGCFFPGLACYLADKKELDRGNISSGNVYHRLLLYISFLLIFSALLHSVAVGALLFKMNRISYYVALSDDTKSHFRRVAIIGALCVVCWVFRSIILVGRVTNYTPLTTGPMSFANPMFSTMYTILLMNLPCMVVCIAFYMLSRRSFEKEAEQQHLLNSAPIDVIVDGTPATSSVVSRSKNQSSELEVPKSTSGPRSWRSATGSAPKHVVV